MFSFANAAYDGLVDNG